MRSFIAATVRRVSKSCIVVGSSKGPSAGWSPAAQIVARLLASKRRLNRHNPRRHFSRSHTSQCSPMIFPTGSKPLPLSLADPARCGSYPISLNSPGVTPSLIKAAGAGIKAGASDYRHASLTVAVHPPFMRFRVSWDRSQTATNEASRARPPPLRRKHPIADSWVRYTARQHNGTEPTYFCLAEDRSGGTSSPRSASSPLIPEKPVGGDDGSCHPQRKSSEG